MLQGCHLLAFLVRYNYLMRLTFFNTEDMLVGNHSSNSASILAIFGKSLFMSGSSQWLMALFHNFIYVQKS